MQFLKRFRLTLGYITCLPLAGKVEGEPVGLAKYLPSVGLLLGGILSIASMLLTALSVDSLFSAVLLAVLWLLLTGGLHMDGLMDTADGIFSHQSRERMLEIMQDPRVGNFGVLSGVSLLLIKITGMAALSGSGLSTVLLLAPMWARLAECYAIGKYSYARAAGKGKIWHDSTSYPSDLIKAAILPLAVSAGLVCLGQYYVLSFTLISMITALSTASYLNRKLQGHTGDTYGAVVELNEALSIAGLVLLSSILHKLAGS